jgi:hypothetical protein
MYCLSWASEHFPLVDESSLAIAATWNAQQAENVQQRRCVKDIEENQRRGQMPTGLANGTIVSESTKS